jgi:hypothetical protein
MPDADPHPWAVRCRGGTCWSCTGASGAPWKPRTRTPDHAGRHRRRPVPRPLRPGPRPPAPRPQLRRDHIQDFIADQLTHGKPATAHNRSRGLRAFVKWAVAEGDPSGQPPGWHATAPLARAPVDVVPAEQLTRLLKSCEGATSPAAATPPASCCWSTPGAAGRMRRHDPGRRRPGPADGVGAGQGPPVAGAADRWRDRPGP